MIQIKCPQCQNVMAVAAAPANGQVMCPRCGQQLILPVPARPVAPVRAPAPVKAMPVRPPQVEEEEIDLSAAPAIVTPVRVVPVTHVSATPVSHAPRRRGSDH